MIESTDPWSAAAAASGGPRHPIAAVTHPDPYPFYANLVARRPFYPDVELNLWIATSAEAVTTVLTHPAGRVRPPGDPVPSPLRGSAVGDLFGTLIRMNDGEPSHDRPRQALLARRDALGDVGRLEAVAEYRAHRLADGMRPWADPGAFTQFASSLSTQVLGNLLGVPPKRVSTS